MFPKLYTESLLHKRVVVDKSTYVRQLINIVTSLVDPVIRVELEDTATVVGSNVSFTCSARGNPTPMIIWSSNSNENITPADESLIPGTHTSTIVLHNVSPSDLNQSYTCTATNEFGTSASSSAFLSEAGMFVYVCV